MKPVVVPVTPANQQSYYLRTSLSTCSGLQNLTCNGQTAKCVLQFHYLTGQGWGSRSTPLQVGLRSSSSSFCPLRSIGVLNSAVQTAAFLLLLPSPQATRVTRPASLHSIAAPSWACAALEVHTPRR